jgi:hypothetical protein
MVIDLFHFIQNVAQQRASHRVGGLFGQKAIALQLDRREEKGPSSVGVRSELGLTTALE